MSTLEFEDTKEMIAAYHSRDNIFDSLQDGKSATPETLRQLREIMADRERLIVFAHHENSSKPSVVVLDAAAKTGKEGRALVDELLAMPAVKGGLDPHWAKDCLYRVIMGSTQENQAAFLSQEGSLAAISNDVPQSGSNNPHTSDGYRAENMQRALKTIKKFTLDQQASVLAAPGNMRELFASGCATQALEAMQPGVASPGLSVRGMFAKFSSNMSDAQKTKILSTPDFHKTLIEFPKKGNEHIHAGVKKIIQSLPADAQKSIKELQEKTEQTLRNRETKYLTTEARATARDADRIKTLAAQRTGNMSMSQ